MLRASIDQMRQAKERDLMWQMEKIKTEMQSMRLELQKRGLPEANYYENQYEELKKSIDIWPQAIEPQLICQDQASIDKRAQVIINLTIGEDLKDKKFLDYGCGNNSIIKESGAEYAVGYDIKGGDGIITDFETIVQSGPYDVILIHDVLDHCEHMTPIDALKQAKSVLKQNGRIYLKNHPWCSRHGNHLYNQINKAYIHLIFDEVELTRLGGYGCEYNLKIITPIETYDYWIKESGLNISSMIALKSKIEDFFIQPGHIRERLLSYWGNDEHAMRINMEIEFVEYVLETKENQIF
jgi:2-polyprenyl-3-methyl-5-hydroxy-6-metoxy-1,4-benzoquinol methylase